MSHFELRPYQKKAVAQLVGVISQHNIAYLVGDVRTGKTLTSLTVAQLLPETETVVFITSKSAIPDIEADYKKGGFKFQLHVTNYESVKKLENVYPDLVIIDEAHRLGAYPKPGKTARLVRALFSRYPTLLMSGTPSPESFSQLYNQFWVTMQGPWKKYINFYKWAKDYVDVDKVYIGNGLTKNNYDNAKENLVMEDFKNYRVVVTQQDAGFKGVIQEKVHTIPLPPYCLTILKALRKEQVFTNGDIDLEADSAVKMQTLFHQISSGTAIDSQGEGNVLDDFKAQYIKTRFAGKKIAIFYLYKKEGELLKKVFKKHTAHPSDFNKSSSLTFIKQVRSGREGVNLYSADALIFFNISYSAVNYLQARARSQSKDGGNKEVHWIFSDQGIEHGIYEIVANNKVDYTRKHFNQYVRDSFTTKDNQVARRAPLHGNKVKSKQQGRLARPNRNKRR